MKVTFPKDEGDGGASESKEPKRAVDFCNDHAVRYIIQRCDFHFSLDSLSLIIAVSMEKIIVISMHWCVC